MAQVASIRALAKALGRSDTSVRKWLRRRNFPVSRTGPWSDADVARLREWMSTLSPDYSDPAIKGRIHATPAGEDEKEHWLMRKYRAQALRAEGQLVNHKVAVTHMLHVLARTRAALMTVPKQLRTQADQQPADVVEKVARNLIATALDTLADRLTEESTNAD